MKLLSILTAILFFSISLSAQNKIPDVVKGAFESMFDGAKSVKWELQEDDEEYEALFKFKRKRMTAKFDLAGNWLETEYEIDEDELPAAVKMVLKVDFVDHEIDSVEKISTPERKEAYELTLDYGEETWKVVFTSSGKVLEKELDDEDE